MKTSNALEARVAATNRVNAAAIDLYGHAVKILTPLIGRKILKVDRTLTKEARTALESLLRLVPDNVRAYARTGVGYTLIVCLSSDEPSTGHRAGTGSSDLYLGDIKNGVLDHLYPAPELRTNYDASSVAALRLRAAEAREAVRLAEAALYPFGTSDN